MLAGTSALVPKLMPRIGRAEPYNRAVIKLLLPIIKSGKGPSQKKALAWAGTDAVSLADPALLNMPQGFRWLHWTSLMEAFASDGLPFPPGKVPMLFGVRSPDGTWDPVTKLYVDIPPDYDGELILINEPDLEWQANLTPQQVADLFYVLATDFPQMKFVVGNMSQRDLTYGGPWLREFLALIRPELRPRIHRIGWHWYDYDPYRRDLNYAVTTVYNILADFGLDYLPSWVTEMGCKRSYPGYLERWDLWCQQALAEPRVEHVFAFCNRDSAEYNGRPVNEFSMIELTSGALLDTGIVYAAI